MAKQQIPIHYLSIPVEGGDIAGKARSLGKHLLALQQLALANLRHTDLLDTGDLEALRAVTDLMIRLREIEEKAADKTGSPP